MAKRAQRAIALIAAVLFLLTSIGFTATVIWQMNKDNSAMNENNQTTPSSAGKPLENFTPVATVSKLQKTDLSVGSGDTVEASDTITAHYTGAVAATGKIFESSYDSGQPATFGLSQVIEGWTKGVPGMKVGGKRRLVIPAEMAYGAQSPSPDIPANSALVFDIELVAIQK